MTCVPDWLTAAQRATIASYAPGAISAAEEYYGSYYHVAHVPGACYRIVVCFRDGLTVTDATALPSHARDIARMRIIERSGTVAKRDRRRVVRRREQRQQLTLEGVT